MVGGSISTAKPGSRASPTGTSPYMAGLLTITLQEVRQLSAHDPTGLLRDLAGR